MQNPANTSNNQSADQSQQVPEVPMDAHLLKACSAGDVDLLSHLLLQNPADILLSKTPHSNNCLHVAAMLGHDDFAKKVWSMKYSLFSDTNIDGETPLIAAVMAANAALASAMITAASNHPPCDTLEHSNPLSEMLMKSDRHGDNVLLHALRHGFKSLALELLAKEQQLSEQVNKSAESPMYMAACKGYFTIVKKLLEIPTSAVSGPRGESALHAAVRLGNKGLVTELLKQRGELAKCADSWGNTPLAKATFYNNLELVKIFLIHDPNLAYIKNPVTKATPFVIAATTGFVSIAEEIRRVCPDSVYSPDINGLSALHSAVLGKQPDFVDYVLKTPQLQRLINQVTNNGSLPLHHAADKCEPELLRLLLSHTGHDYTAVNNRGDNAVNTVYGNGDSSVLKTLKWNECFTLLSKAIPSGWKHLIRDDAKQKIRCQAIQDVKSLTQKYTTNTSVVAVLLATITFAAAFTLPGGYSSDKSDAGLPIFARKASFLAFLVSDTMAMCSSLAAAFLCILATWDDLDFLLNYRKTTRALMWYAYVATLIAFGTGLFTVLKLESLWLAILILVLCIIFPVLSKIIGDWPLPMLWYRLGNQFQNDLIPNI